MKIDSLLIVPTGDEVADAIICDTDSPAITDIMRTIQPECRVTTHKPLCDNVNGIKDFIQGLNTEFAAVAILVGGSGGGKHYDPSLAPDCTHQAMRQSLSSVTHRDLIGYNGHLWCRIVVGMQSGTLCFNVPGPQVEAEAAAQAGLDYIANAQSINCENLADCVAKAVFAQYPGEK